MQAPIKAMNSPTGIRAAAFLGMAGRRGRIAVGQTADLVALDERLSVTATWIAGAICGARLE